MIFGRSTLEFQYSSSSQFKYLDEQDIKTYWIIFCYYRTEGLLWVISCLTSAILTSFFWTGAIRFALRLLFTYQGWMFLSRDGWKKPSILLKLWLITLQVKLVPLELWHFWVISWFFRKTVGFRFVVCILGGVKSLVSRHIVGYSFWSIWGPKLRQPTGQSQDSFNFGPSLLKF